MAADNKSLVNKVRETIENLDLGPEDAAIAEYAEWLAGVIDRSESQLRPLDPFDEAIPEGIVIRRIRELERHRDQVRTVEKVGSVFLATMKEMGATPGARARAAEVMRGGGDEGVDELSELRAARTRGA
jgi:hypothetical protein